MHHSAEALAAGHASLAAELRAGNHTHEHDVRHHVHHDAAALPTPMSLASMPRGGTILGAMTARAAEETARKPVPREASSGAAGRTVRV